MTVSGLIAAGLIVVLAGIISGHAALAVVGMLLATVGTLSWLWSAYLLSGVSLSMTLSADRVRPGGQVRADIVIENDQPFPVPWLDCTIDWPSGLETSGRLTAHFLPGRHLLSQAFTMRWFERVSRRVAVSCPRRGEYVIGPATLTVADPFGLTEGRREVDARGRLVVYPRIVPVRPPVREARSPFGHQPRPSWIYDDPAHFRGAREYVAGDPYSRIEWKATARTGRLHTRLLDASYATEVAVVVNVGTRPKTWEGISTHLLERTLVVAASIIAHSVDAGHRVALYTNGFVRGNRGLALARMGSGATQLRACMEVLGRLMPVQAAPFPAALEAAGRQAGDRARLLVVTGLLGPGLERLTGRLISRGCAVSVIASDTGSRPWRGRTPLYEVLEEGGAPDLEQITINPVGR